MATKIWKVGDLPRCLDEKCLPWDQPANHCQTISGQLEHQPSSNHTQEERTICKLASL